MNLEQLVEFFYVDSDIVKRVYAAKEIVKAKNGWKILMKIAKDVDAIAPSKAQAIVSLPECEMTSTQREETCKYFIFLLLHENENIVRSAVYGLVKLKDKRAIPHLEKLRKKLPEQKPDPAIESYLEDLQKKAVEIRGNKKICNLNIVVPRDAFTKEDIEEAILKINPKYKK